MPGRLCVALTLLLAAVALRAAQAGEPPTARIMVNPVPAKVGPPYPPLIGGGPDIVGNELRLDAGGRGKGRQQRGARRLLVPGQS